MTPKDDINIASAIFAVIFTFLALATVNIGINFRIAGLNVYPGQ